MKIRFWMSLPALSALALLFAATAWGQAAAHLGHINDGWKDTPGGVGLVTALAAEAKVAATHAGYANPSNLSAMQTHTPHVRHAIDAGSESGGPGKGYGTLKAAQGVAAHMDFARNSPDASDSLKMHAVHVISAANNIVKWAGDIMALSETVVNASSTAAASGAMKKIQAMTQWIVKGHDADGDGKISWKAGEGGLAQLKQHLGFIKQ